MDKIAVDEFLNDLVELRMMSNRPLPPYYLGWMDQLRDDKEAEVDRIWDSQDDEEWYLTGKLDAINGRQENLFSYIKKK